MKEILIKCRYVKRCTELKNVQQKLKSFPLKQNMTNEVVWVTLCKCSHNFSDSIDSPNLWTFNSKLFKSDFSYSNILCNFSCRIDNGVYVKNVLKYWWSKLVCNRNTYLACLCGCTVMYYLLSPCAFESTNANLSSLLKKVHFAGVNFSFGSVTWSWCSDRIKRALATRNKFSYICVLHIVLEKM